MSLEFGLQFIGFLILAPLWVIAYNLKRIATELEEIKESSRGKG